MQQRDPLIQTLLSFFIPFYQLYWFYVTSKEVRQAYQQKMPSMWLLFAPALAILAMIPLSIAIFAASADSDGSGGGGIAVASILIILVMLPLSFALSLVYFYKFGGGIENVAGSDASRVLIFILLFFIPAAAVFIVQEKLNKLQQFGGSQPTQPVAATPIHPQAPVAPQAPRPEDPTQQF